MIISPDRGYIFVHIPKTGGTAMTLALEARAKASDIILSDTPKGRRRRARLKGAKAAGRIWKHSTLADITGLVSDEQIAGSFVFTLVRNPWDRLVSYYHWLRAQSFAHPAVGLSRTHDFAGFLTHPQTIASLRAAPYASYVRRLGGEERCDLFIRLEHLETDMAALAEHLGFVPVVGRGNPSVRPADYRLAYDEATAALVADLCAEDISRFGYSF